MHPTSQRRPEGYPRKESLNRPEGSAPTLASQSQGVEGRPPLAPFLTLLACLLIAGLSFVLGKSSAQKPVQIVGFLVGSFASVVALAWFVVRDNMSRSRPYRDWPISAKSMTPWLLIGAWLLGTANVFLLALDISRGFVE